MKSGNLLLIETVEERLFAGMPASEEINERWYRGLQSLSGAPDRFRF
jgi:hypothetical protein